MAKMFYTLEEAAQKLGKSEDEVRELASSGRVQEFRDRDKLMFKVDQVDLLAEQEDGEDGGDDELSLESDMSGMLPLGDTSGGGDSIGLESSGEESSVALEADDSGESAPKKEEKEEDVPAPSAGESGSMIGLEPTGESGTGVSLEGEGDAGDSGEQDSKQKTGVSIFDADELDTADPAAATLVTDEGELDDISTDQVGSGSGLMELTRESDDTSLGADAFLEELGSADDSAEGAPPSATGLFEGAGEEEPELAGAAAPGAGAAAIPEPYDGAWSGLTGGLAFGMILSLALALAVIISSMMGVATEDFVDLIAGNLMIWVGSLAGVTLIAAFLGFILGRRS